MSDYKQFVVPLAAFGLAYTLCPVAEEHQPHGPHHDYSPAQVPTINYYTSGSSSMTGPVRFSSVVDSADVVMARHRARREPWQRTMGSTIAETPGVLKLT